MLGVVTVGQSPRPDLERAFASHAPGARIEVRGALDGLGAAEIAALAAGAADYPILARLGDGSMREIPLASIHPLVEQRAQELARLGARAVVVACAGGFPDVACEIPVLLPGRLLPAVASALTRERRIGVVSPIRSQVAAAKRKWRGDGFDPVVTWASPQSAEEIGAACSELRERGVALVVLDCFGFGDDGARAVADLVRRPVLAARSVTARIAGELLRG